MVLPQRHPLRHVHQRKRVSKNAGTVDIESGMYRTGTSAQSARLDNLPHVAVDRRRSYTKSKIYYKINSLTEHIRIVHLLLHSFLPQHALLGFPGF